MAKQFTYYKTSRREFLEGVRNRLQDDVAPYFELIEKIAADSYVATGDTKIVGNWALVRMIFPPINAVAVVLYRSKDKDKRQREADVFSRLLLKLNVEYPRIVLEMYRHSLIHRDGVRGVVLAGHQIMWSISSSGMSHIYNKDAIMIDMKTLYQDLITFLGIEIASSGGRVVWVEERVKYIRPLPPSLGAEIQELLK